MRVYVHFSRNVFIFFFSLYNTQLLTGKENSHITKQCIQLKYRLIHQIDPLTYFENSDIHAYVVN